MTIPYIKGLQIDLGLARVAGDSDVYWGLLLHLARHWEDTLADFETAVREQDAARLGLLAHKLKGVAGNLGAADLEDWAARLERMASQPVSQAAQDCLPALRACLRDLSRGILEQLHDWPGAQVSLSSPSVSWEAQLQKLLRELDNCDGEALDTWCDLAVRLRGRLSPEEIAGLDELIQDFDFASARRVLQARLI